MNRTSDGTAISREWRACIEPLLAVGERIGAKLSHPADADQRWRLYRFLYSQIGAAYVGLLHADPQHPDWWPMFNEVFNEGFPNPDDSYYATPIDDTGVYRISGQRGTVRILDLQVGGGPLIPRGTGMFGPTYANYDFDTLSLGEDGAFDVVLSRERPEGHRGDWWKLDPGGTYLLIRQRAYDVVCEIDGRLAIERLDRAAIKPPPSAEAIEAQLRHIANWVEGWSTVSLDWVQRIREQGLVNQFHVKDYGYTSGISTQRYVEGYFDIAADEALIVESEVPERSRYWNFQLTDEFWSTVGALHRQSTLNGYTARLDADGRFRAVISARDPAVPNWLDTAGLQRGLVYGRWMDCSRYPNPVMFKVKVADVRRHLPADTPVVTPASRDAAVRIRRQGVQLRRRW